MAVAYSRLLQLTYGPSQLGTSSGGLGGAGVQDKSPAGGGHIRGVKATFTVPSTGAGSAAGDVIYLCKFNSFTDVYQITVYHLAWGDSTTLARGRLDPNNSSNTDANFYASPTDMTLQGSFLCGGRGFVTSVGTDPTGAVGETGNAQPNYGGAQVIMTATIGGTPTAAATVAVIIFFGAGA